MSPGRRDVDQVSRSPFLGLIYGVREAGSPEFRYVGLTTRTVAKRRQQHLRAVAAGKRTPFADWLRTFENPESVYFQPLELLMGDDLQALGEAEVRWIAKLRREGHRLLNLNDGGLGNHGYVWTAEQRAAAGDRVRGTKRGHYGVGPDNPWWGRRHTEEQKAKWSADRKGTNRGADNPNFGKFGPEHPSYGHSVSDETKALLSEQKRGANNPNFGKKASAETRAKQSAAQKGKSKPSSVRSAHTRYHTNKGVFKDTCQHCLDDQGRAAGASGSPEFCVCLRRVTVKC